MHRISWLLSWKLWLSTPRKQWTWSRRLWCLSRCYFFYIDYTCCLNVSQNTNTRDSPPCNLLCLRKRKKKPRPKKGKKAFSCESAADLASSNKGSFYNQDKWLQEIEEHEHKLYTSEKQSVYMNARRFGIQLEAEEEQEYVASRVSFMSILSWRCWTAGDLSLRTGLGSTWIICCNNESCLLHVTNSSFEKTEAKGLWNQSGSSSRTTNCWQWPHGSIQNCRRSHSLECPTS